MLKRWERMGQRVSLLTLDRDYLKAAAAVSRERYARYKSPAARWDVDRVYSNMVYSCICILTHWHIENAEPIDGCNRPRDIAKMLVNHVVEYLFGDWRDGYVNVSGKKRSRQQCRNECDWFTEYRAGLAAAILLDDQSLVDMLAKWPGDDLEFYDAKLELNDTWQHDDIPYHVALATFLRGESWENPFSQLHKSTAGVRGRPVLLASAIDALVEERVADFHKLITRHLKCFLSKEFFKEQFDQLISWEASILCGLARQRGLPFPDFPIELDDLIIRPDTVFG